MIQIILFWVILLLDCFCHQYKIFTLESIYIISVRPQVPLSWKNMLLYLNPTLKKMNSRRTWRKKVFNNLSGVVKCSTATLEIERNRNTRICQYFLHSLITASRSSRRKKLTVAYALIIFTNSFCWYQRVWKKNFWWQWLGGKDGVKFEGCLWSCGIIESIKTCQLIDS